MVVRLRALPQFPDTLFRPTRLVPVQIIPEERPRDRPQERRQLSALLQGGPQDRLRLGGHG